MCGYKTILGNRERTQSASLSSDSNEKKLMQILQPPNLVKTEIIFDIIEVIFNFKIKL